MPRAADQESNASPDKGKTPEQLDNPGAADGLVTRIGTSASQLLNATFSNPDHAALRQSLDAATSIGEKASLTNASNDVSSHIEVGQSSMSAGSIEGSFRGEGQCQSETLNASHRTQEDFDHFVSHQESLIPEAVDTKIHDNFGSMDVGNAAIKTQQADPRTQSMTQDGLDHIHPSDGSAVVELLNQRGATLDESDLQNPNPHILESGDFAEVSGDYSFDHRRSQAADRGIKPLSLVPNWSLVDSDVMNEETMRQWLSILDDYHDEVWGPDLPTVKSAKQELNNALKAKDGLKLTQSPAVQRLRMLLKHMYPTI